MEDPMADMNLGSLLDKAIKNEEDAHAFYMNLHGIVSDADAKSTLLFLADQEKKHKEFLVAYKSGSYANKALAANTAIDYAIAQYVDAPDIEKNMKTKDVYLVAAHRELNSYNFYKGLAAVQPAGEVKDVLVRMADEELKHKEKVEYLYANSAFPQTEGG